MSLLCSSVMMKLYKAITFPNSVQSKLLDFRLVCHNIKVNTYISWRRGGGGTSFSDFGKKQGVRKRAKWQWVREKIEEEEKKADNLREKPKIRVKYWFSENLDLKYWNFSKIWATRDLFWSILNLTMIILGSRHFPFFGDTQATQQNRMTRPRRIVVQIVRFDIANWIWKKWKFLAKNPRYVKFLI